MKKEIYHDAHAEMKKRKAKKLFLFFLRDRKLF